MCITEFNKDVYEAGILAEGKEIGRQEGRREGRREGRQEGRREERQGLLAYMLEMGMITPEQAQQLAKQREENSIA